jgi:hypothetical protein
VQLPGISILLIHYTRRGSGIIPSPRSKSSHSRGQVTAVRLVRAVGMPIPEVMFAGMAEPVGGHPLKILRYLPGMDAEEVLPKLDAASRIARSRPLGTLSRWPFPGERYSWNDHGATRCR